MLSIFVIFLIGLVSGTKLDAIVPTRHPTVRPSSTVPTSSVPTSLVPTSLVPTSLVPTTSTTSTSTIWYVKASATTNGDGESWSTAFNSLVSALSSADNGDQIWVTEGTYVPTTNSEEVTASFMISKSLNIYGGFVGTETSINQRTDPLPSTILSGHIGSGSQVYHVVQITGYAVTLDGLIIEGGFATGIDDGTADCDTCFGGGLYIAPETEASVGSSLKLHDKRKNNNRRNNIGDTAKYFYTFTSITVRNNSAIQGGGIYAFEDMEIEISDSTFEYNKVFDGSYHEGSGGAIFISFSSTLTVSSSSFIGNVASSFGGAVNCDYGITAEFDTCDFQYNHALNGHGGAIYITDRSSDTGTTSITSVSSTFSYNTAKGYGGAIFAYYSATPSISSSTFTGNSATRGGAIGFYDAICTTTTCMNTCTTGNTYSGNTVTDPDYATEANCYVAQFPSEMSGYTTSNYLPYLQRVWQSYDSSDEPETVANTLYVDNSVSESGNGLSWNNSVKTIQEAIDLIQTKYDPITYEIWVRGGTNINYVPTVVPPWYNTSAYYYDPEKSKLIDVLASIHIYGGFAGTETQRSQRNFYANPTRVSGYVETDVQVYQIFFLRTNSYIDGFIISDAYAYVTTSSDDDLKDSIIEEHNVGINSDSSYELTSKIPNRGAGIFANATDASFANCLIMDNFAFKGAGAYILYHQVTATNIMFLRNYATARGGGLGLDVSAEFTCTSCVFIGNTCERKGGAIYSDYYSDAYFYNGEFYNNSAYDSGGAIALDGTGYMLLYSTVVLNNTAFMSGAGIYAGSYGSLDPSKTNYYEIYDVTVQGNLFTTGFNEAAANYYLWNFDYITTLTSGERNNKKKKTKMFN